MEVLPCGSPRYIGIDQFEGSQSFTNDVGRSISTATRTTSSPRRRRPPSPN